MNFKIKWLFILILLYLVACNQKQKNLTFDKEVFDSSYYSPWGVQFNPLPPHVDVYPDEYNLDELLMKTDTLAEIAANIGVKWVRFSVNWSSIMTREGSFTWEYTDRAIKQLNKNNINILFCINGGHEKHTSHMSVQTQFEMNAWLSMLDSLTMRYKGKVYAYEIWNEPNTIWFWKPNPSPKQYYQLVKEAYSVIKKNDDKVLVVGGSLARNDLPWADTLVKLGITNYIDVFSIHPYGEFPEAILKPIRRPVVTPVLYMKADHSVYDLKELLKPYNIPVWQAECGYPALPNSSGWNGNGPWGETIQAKWMLRRFMTDMEFGSKISIYFALADYKDHPEAKKINRKGLIKYEDLKSRFILDVFKNFSSNINGNLVKSNSINIKIDSIVDYGDFEGALIKDFRTLELSNESDTYIAYWLPWRMQENIERGTLVLNVGGSNSIKLYDFIEKETKSLKTINGKVSLPFGDYPIFIKTN